MARRSEPRITISFPVIVRGFDAQRRPFSVNAETCDISAGGACLQGLSSLVEAGSRIELQFRDRSVWYRVQWVRKNGPDMSGRAGVRCLERKYIWNIPQKPWEPDVYNQNEPIAQRIYDSSIPGGGRERRQYPRRACRIEAQISASDSASLARGTITDISLNGCYVELLSPLPVDSAIVLAFNLDNATLHINGRVRTSQMSFGMGVSFTGMSPEDLQRLRKFAPAPVAAPSGSNGTSHTSVDSRSAETATHLANAPNASTSLARQSDVSTARTLEVVIRVLIRKGVLSREDLVQEFEKVQTANR
ncbi:MAG: PilZ domain-containing protein [Candidatus Acidiferrales bacterium]